MRYSLFLLVIALGSFSCHHKRNNVIDHNNSRVVMAYRATSQLGEGAFWNHETKCLWWVDILGKTFNIYDPSTKANRTYPTSSMIGTVVPMDNGLALVALQDGLYTINLSSGSLDSFLSMEADIPINRFNDGKCDPAGRLWVGSLNLKEDSASAFLYSIDWRRKVTQHLSGIRISNGIVWTKDTKTMYYIDTPTKQIRAYDYDVKEGTISQERVAVNIDEALGYPDGMAIDEEDKLWIGMWNGNCVARFNPIDGTLMETIPVPAHNVTACAFGGPKLDTLYITTASVDMTDEEKVKYPDAGSLFKIVPGVKGVRSPFYRSK